MQKTLVCSADSSPGKVCKEAANNILLLVGHHESLSAGAQVSGHLQSFKNAAIGYLDVYDGERQDKSQR